MLIGKRIAILAEEGFEDIEMMEPLRAMKDAGARVLVVGSGSQTSYRGKKGNAIVTVETTADKVKAEDFDAIIVPGGYAPARMRRHQSMIDLVRKAYDAGKVVAAVCHGPQLLISADIVRGRRLTSWPSVAIELKNAGSIWVDEPVVKDGNLITARKPSDLPRFNKAIIESLTMTASQYTLQKILERAIDKEIDSHNLYVTLSNRVKDQYARDALLDLAKYEKEHQVLLERYQRGELKEGSLSSDQPIDYKIAEQLEQAAVSADMQLKDIFMLAARREKASHEFYLSLAGIHRKGEVRRMLEQLASQELEHKQKVEFLYTEVAFPQTDGG